MKNINFTERQRIVENSLYLKSSLEDVAYASPYFTIETEEGTYVKYKKTRIKFSPVHGEQDWSWLIPEVDTINLVDLCSHTKYLFTSLRNAGYNSFLIDSYAQLEESTNRFPDPELDSFLIKRVAAKASKKDPDRKLYRFHLNGGSLFFHRILEKDPLFWRQIIKAATETDLVSIAELHLAADCNNDLMSYITKAISRGHYESNGLRVHGFYWLSGKKYKSALGKRSQIFPRLRKESFRIETVYFGNTSHEPVSIACYDKTAEQLQRKNAVSTVDTRIELRLNPLLNHSFPKDVIYNIIASYYAKDGESYRTRIFLTFICSQLRFTNHFDAAGKEDLALWWRHQFIMPLAHASLQAPRLTPLETLSKEKNQRLLPASSDAPRKRGRPKGCKDKVKRKPKTAKRGLGDIIDV